MGKYISGLGGSPNIPSVVLNNNSVAISAAATDKYELYMLSGQPYLMDSSGTSYKVIRAESNGRIVLDAALDGATAGSSNLHQMWRRLTNTNGLGVGIGFSVSADDNVGGKILFVREGPNSQGRFEFWLKTATTSGDTTVLRMALQHAGALDLPEISAPATPASGYGRYYWNTSGEMKAVNDGGVTFTMGGPGFDATHTANQTVTAGVATILTWDTEAWDSNGWFASNRFTPQVAGWYLVQARAAFSGAASGGTILYLLKNGATIPARASAVLPSGTTTSLTVVKLMQFNGSSDYVEAVGYAQTTTITKVNNDGGFSAVKVG